MHDEDREHGREDRPVDEEARDHVRPPLFLLRRLRVFVRRRLSCRGCRGGRPHRRRPCTGAPGPIFITPSTITRSPGLRPAVDDPAVAGPVADLDRARLGLALGVDDVDELALGAFQHGALRDHDRVRAHRAREHDAHELARRAARRRGWRISARASLVPVCGVDAHVGEVEHAGAARRALPSASLTVDLEAPVRRAASGGRPRRRAACARRSRSGMPKIT